MKLRKAGALTAIAGMAFVACSGDKSAEVEPGTASVSYGLVAPPGVEILSVDYDLNTQGGADVKNGSIPVPNDDSVIDGFIGELPLGDYALGFSAQGTYNNGTIDCATEQDTLFSLTQDGQTLMLDDITLVCTVEVEVGEDTANVTFNVDVDVQELEVLTQVIETFVVAPTTAPANDSSGQCVWAPITIDVNNTNSNISYSWSASPDGTFTPDPLTTSGSYNCASGGAKTLTVSATLNGTTATANIPVTCGDCGGGTGTTGGGTTPVCGNGPPAEQGEECDEGVATECCSANCVDLCDPACMDCVNADATAGAFNQSSCSADTDPLCNDIRECMVRAVDTDGDGLPETNANCYQLGVAYCYCGIGADLSACEGASFVATGPCADLIRQGATPEGETPEEQTNLEILQKYVNANYAFGKANLILSSVESSGTCDAECNLNPNP